MSIFKKHTIIGRFERSKAGGVLGSVAKGAADKFTGGLVSAVMNNKPKESNNVSTRTSSIVQPPINNLTDFQNTNQTNFMDKLKQLWATNKMLVIGAIVAIGAGVYFFVIRKKRGFRR